MKKHIRFGVCFFSHLQVIKNDIGATECLKVHVILYHNFQTILFINVNIEGLLRVLPIIRVLHLLKIRNALLLSYVFIKIIAFDLSICYGTQMTINMEGNCVKNYDM